MPFQIYSNFVRMISPKSFAVSCSPYQVLSRLTKILIIMKLQISFRLKGLPHCIHELSQNIVESVQKGILWQLLYRIKSDDSNTWMVNRCIYHILRKTVTCDTFPEVKLYIFFLTREIHRKNRRSRCFGNKLTV